MNNSKYICIRIKLLLSFFIFCSTLGYSQSDLASWASYQLSYKINTKSSISIRPILRHNNNLSSIQDVFFDTSFDYKINKFLKIKILNRVVSNFKGNYGLAFFFDVSSMFAISNHLNFVNRLRYHLGLDLELFGKDFLRYEPKLIFNKLRNIEFILAMDYTYSIEKPNRTFRYRYQIGSSLIINKRTKAVLFYWLEKFPNILKRKNRHIINTSIIFSLNK